MNIHEGIEKLAVSAADRKEYMDSSKRIRAGRKASEYGMLGLIGSIPFNSSKKALSGKIGRGLGTAGALSYLGGFYLSNSGERRMAKLKDKHIKDR